MDTVSLALVPAPVSLCGDSCIDEIIPGLLLGNAAAAQNISLMQARGITHIVTAAVSDGFGALYPEHFQYSEVLLEDDRSAPIVPHLHKTSDFIEAALTAHGTLFVHCKVGTSRSVSIVLHYLIAKRNVSLLAAIRHVMGQRARNPRAPYTHPNVGFMRGLIGEEFRIRGSNSLTLSDYLSSYSTGRNIPHDGTSTAQISNVV